MDFYVTFQTVLFKKITRKKMKIILLNKTTESRLVQVVSEMVSLGAPVVQCFELEDCTYLALEGSHRLTAAKQLGMIPILDVVDKIEKADPEMEKYYIDAKRRELKGLTLEFEDVE